MSNLLSNIRRTLSKQKRALIRGNLRYRRIKNNVTLNHFPFSANLNSGIPSAHFEDLRAKIDVLKTHIDRDYCFLDLPEYNNIGDHMICEGSLNLLSALPYRNKYKASIQSFQKSQIVNSDLILLQGGGNFGDMWSIHQHFREKIISSFKENKIIILPQTIFFQENENLKKSATIFSTHDNLTICVRDQRSFEIANTWFSKNIILLLPDMASYIQCGLVRKEIKKIRDVLLLQRNDKEQKRTFDLSYIKKLEIKDWPTIDSNYFSYLSSRYKKNKLYLNEGIIFLANYDLVITTRLHGFILATLLGIPTILLDNSYGKNYRYYATWMIDVPNCYFADTEKEVRRLLQQHFPEVII